MQRQILVTGGNSGIGLEMVKAFAAAGHDVVVAARDRVKTERVLAPLRARYPHLQLSAISLDLAQLDSIDAAAQQILAQCPRLDTVMVNAGSFTRGLRTAWGIESMFATMHVGHFALMQQLLPRLAEAPAARVIVTSSVAHWAGHWDEAKVSQPDRYRTDFQAYGTAKLANLMYARELARRVSGSAIRVNAFHPGGVATGIWRELPGPIQKVVDRVLITPAKGADTGVWLALSPEAAQFQGGYFVRRRPAMTKKESRHVETAQRLWTWTEQTLSRLRG